MGGFLNPPIRPYHYFCLSHLGVCIPIVVTLLSSILLILKTSCGVGCAWGGMWGGVGETKEAVLEFTESGLVTGWLGYKLAPKFKYSWHL